MANARIAALSLALLSASLAGQESSKIQVKVKVFDATGALVSGADIKADSSKNGPSEIAKANDKGEAILELSVGEHDLSISCPGFFTWTKTVDVQSSLQSIEVVLDVAGTMDPVVITWSPDVQAEQSLIAEFIPLRPLINLEPLPTLRRKRRW